MRLIDADAAVNEIDDVFSANDGMALIPTGITKALVKTLLTLENITPTVGGWISIEDRLPDDARRVLCCTKTQKGVYNIVIGYYMGGMWRCGMNSNVVFWMELPKVPE
jgi:hypothetical protein